MSEQAPRLPEWLSQGMYLQAVDDRPALPFLTFLLPFFHLQYQLQKWPFGSQALLDGKPSLDIETAAPSDNLLVAVEGEKYFYVNKLGLILLESKWVTASQVGQPPKNPSKWRCWFDPWVRRSGGRNGNSLQSGRLQSMKVTKSDTT